MTDEPQVVEDEQEVEETDSAKALEAELAAARKALKEANREAADRRKKLEQYEKAEAERLQAEMTELDKAKAEAEQARKDAETARNEARLTLIRSAFVSEAAKQGAAYPEDVYQLADKSGVEVDDSGAVTGVAEAVKGLVDSGRIPLAGKAPAPRLDGGAGGGDRSDSGKLTPQELAVAKSLRLSPEQYAKQKAVVHSDEYQERKAVATG